MKSCAAWQIPVSYTHLDEALAEVIRLLTDDEFGVIASVDEIDAVGRQRGAGPVSYTHLDVYKRQSLHLTFNKY